MDYPCARKEFGGKMMDAETYSRALTQRKYFQSASQYCERIMNTDTTQPKTKQAQEMDEVLRPERFQLENSEFAFPVCPKVGRRDIGPDDDVWKMAETAHADAIRSITTASQGGTKHDNGKAPLSLIDANALTNIAAVLEFGRKKYGAHNWRRGFSGSRLLDATLRHIYAYADGEDFDPESGLSHLAHAGCCVVFMLGLLASGRLVDDRHAAPEAAEAGRQTPSNAGETVHLQESAE